MDRKFVIHFNSIEYKLKKGITSFQSYVME